MHGIQLLTVFLTYMSMLCQYNTLRTMAFIKLIPGCPECSCLRTRKLSIMKRVIALFKLLKISCEVRRQWMLEKPAKFLDYWTFCFSLFTGIFLLVSVHWKSSSALIAVMMVWMFELFMDYEAWQSIILTKFCYPLILYIIIYPNKMIAQYWSWWVEYTGILFF